MYKIHLPCSIHCPTWVKFDSFTISEQSQVRGIVRSRACAAHDIDAHGCAWVRVIIDGFKSISLNRTYKLVSYALSYLGKGLMELICS